MRVIRRDRDQDMFRGAWEPWERIVSYGFVQQMAGKYRVCPVRYRRKPADIDT